MKGYEILSKVLNNEIKPKTIIRTEHEIEYFDDFKEYDYYLIENDKMLHRCDENGKLGSKFQDRFLNYKVLQKEFEIYKEIEELKIEQKITGITITDSYGNVTEIKPMIEDGTKKIQNIKLDSEECIEYYEDGIKKHLNTNKKDKMYVKVLNEIIDYINKGE